VTTHYFRNNRGFGGGLKTVAINRHSAFYIYDNGLIRPAMGSNDFSLKRARQVVKEGHWREVKLRRRKQSTTPEGGKGL